MEHTVSKFFVHSDPRIDHMVYPIPIDWWSRPYEYAWAAKFAEKDDVVLDAACGIPHHFKFFLADTCKEVHVCDNDSRIMNGVQIREGVRQYHGETAVKTIVENDYLNKIEFRLGDITALSYQDKMFDKVFCISVLEHLESEELTLKTLNEFKRVLKDDGLIVLTYDYPDITPQILYKLASEAGLKFVNPKVEMDVPEGAIFSGQYYHRDLRCCMALLRKAK